MTGRRSGTRVRPPGIVSRTFNSSVRPGNWPPNSRWQWDSDHRTRTSQRVSNVFRYINEAVDLSTGAGPYGVQHSASSVALAEQIRLPHIHPYSGPGPPPDQERSRDLERQSRNPTERDYQPCTRHMPASGEDGEQSFPSRRPSHDDTPVHDHDASYFGIQQPNNFGPRHYYATNTINASYWPHDSNASFLFSPQFSPLGNSAACASTLPQQPSHEYTQLGGLLGGFELGILTSVTGTESVHHCAALGVSFTSTALPSLHETESIKQQSKYNYTQETQAELGNESTFYANVGIESPDLSSVCGLVNWDGPANYEYLHGQHTAVFLEGDSYKPAMIPSLESLNSALAESYAGLTGIASAQRLSSIPVSPVPSVPPLVEDEELLASPQCVAQPSTPEDVNLIMSPSVLPSPQLEGSPPLDTIEEHRCDFCGNVYIKKHALNKHLKTHVKPHKCLFVDCPRHEDGFAVKRDRDRHINSVHGGDERFNCPLIICPRHESPFSRRDNLKRHVRDLHPDL